MKTLPSIFRKSKINKPQLYFKAISSLLLFSIQKADEPLSRELLEFYFDAFISFRKGKKGMAIEYPQEFYDTIFEANGLLCMRMRRPISDFNDSTLFSLFIDQYQETKISPVTFSFLWKLIIQSLYYDRDDFIFSYWKQAHQLFNFFMKSTEPKFDDNFKTINEKEIKDSEREREEFIEFHYAIGGYLMYLGKYELIQKVVNWTNQKPPKYLLVPETMNEVVKKYMSISQKEEYRNPVYFEQKYPFPEVTGVDANSFIKMWIKRYISVLFIRQYTLHSYYTFSKPLAMPSLPTELSEKKRWNEELDGLKAYVNEYLGKQDVLNQLGLGKLGNPNWFKENEKESPNSLIDNFRSEINEAFKKTIKEQKVDSKKEKEFEEKTAQIINSVFEQYSKIFRTECKELDYGSFYILGRYQLMEKAGFAANQEIAYINSDSVVAESVAIELQNLMLNAFLFMKEKTFKLSNEEIFYAIDQLNINKNDFLIISIGLNLKYFGHLGITNLIVDNDSWSYKGIKIININNSMNTSVSQSLWVIRKDDLPCISHNEVDKKVREKYKLNEIDKKNHIYGSILDLNAKENKLVRDEVAKSSEDKDLTLSDKVIVCVDLKTEIRYKKNALCIQLKSFSQFEDRGIINKLSDIKNFDNYEK